MELHVQLRIMTESKYIPGAIKFWIEYSAYKILFYIKNFDQNYWWVLAARLPNIHFEIDRFYKSFAASRSEESIEHIILKWFSECISVAVAKCTIWNWHCNFSRIGKWLFSVRAKKLKQAYLLQKGYVKIKIWWTK